MKLEFNADEFCWIFNTNEIINITRDLDSDFYDGLDRIMNNQYRFEFPEKLTYKTNDKLCWYSDLAGDIEDETITDSCSRLNIKLEDGIFKIWAEKPIYIKYKSNINYHCIVFSPGGNGQGAIDIQSGHNLQDDIVINLFSNILHPEYCSRILKLM